MKSLVIQAVTVASVAHAYLREDRRPINTKSMTFAGSHTEHTTDNYGRFKHPFRQEDPAVQSIFYENSKTFSTKIHRVKGASRHDYLRQDKQRALGKHKTQGAQSDSYWQSIKGLFTNTYSQTFEQGAMENYWNLLYLGEIHLGTPLQSFMVVWDTGSGTLLLKSSDCSSCEGEIFDVDASSTFQYNSPSDYDRVTYMDGTSLYGQLSTDRTCPVTDTASCATDFQFVAISSSSGLREYEDGIIGLWSGNRSSYDNTEMIMPKLKADGALTDEVFSFYLTDEAGDSYIDFGTPNEAAMSDPADLIYIDIIDNNIWWTEHVTGVRWGPAMNDPVEYSLESTEGITDTGSSCIIGPYEQVGSIRNTLLNMMSSTRADSGWDYLFDCDDADDLPSFELLYGGYWFEVTKDDYVIDLDDNICSLCLSPYSGLDEWILGDAFMRGWYNIHDHDNLRMGFVPHATSAKTKPEVMTTAPTEPFPLVEDPNLAFDFFGLTAQQFALAVFIASTLVLVTVLIYFVYCAKVVAASNRKGNKSKGVTDDQISLIILK